VFTARYALSPYIKQIRFVFKGLKTEGVLAPFPLLLSDMVAVTQILVYIYERRCTETRRKVRGTCVWPVLLDSVGSETQWLLQLECPGFTCPPNHSACRETMKLMELANRLLYSNNSSVSVTLA
jgi:hypothetical protein